MPFLSHYLIYNLLRDIYLNTISWLDHILLYPGIEVFAAL